MDTPFPTESFLHLSAPPPGQVLPCSPSLIRYPFHLILDISTLFISLTFKFSFFIRLHVYRKKMSSSVSRMITVLTSRSATEMDPMLLPSAVWLAKGGTLVCLGVKGGCALVCPVLVCHSHALSGAARNPTPPNCMSSYSLKPPRFENEHSNSLHLSVVTKEVELRVLVPFKY